MNWVEKEVRGYYVFLFIGVAIIADFIYSTGFCVIAYQFGVKISPVTEQSPALTGDFWNMLIIMAFIEELLFRLPLAIPVKLNWSSRNVLVVTVILSALFGWAHGADHIFIQGMSGFIYSIIFLKCGGFQKKFSKAFLSVVATHFLFNAVASVLAIVADKI